MSKSSELVLVTAYTPTLEKTDNLRELIKKIKSYGYKVCLSTHTSTPQDIIDRCDYFIYDKDNELNYDIDIRHWRYYTTSDFFISYKPNNIMATHIVPIVKLIVGSLSYLKKMGVGKVHLLEYDTIMENDDIFVKLSSELDNFTIAGFLDGWVGAKNDNRDKYMFGPLMALNVDQIDVSDFPTDSSTLVSLFRKYFHEDRTPATERIIYDLLWSRYSTSWNEFEPIKKSLSVNTSAYEPLSYSDRTYCFFGKDGKLNFFAENSMGVDWNVDLIINEEVKNFEVPVNQWRRIVLEEIQNVKTLKVIINNKFMEELDFSSSDVIERITKWVHFRENNKVDETAVDDIVISFDMTPIVEVKKSNGNTKIVNFVGIDDNNNEYLVYTAELSDGRWAKPNTTYYKNWKVYIDGELKYVTDMTLDSVCVAVATYPNSEDVKNKTVDTINNIKDNLQIPVICTSHIHYEPNPNELIDISDHYIMNPINTLTKQSYYRYYRGTHDNYNVFIDLWESENSYYHGPAVHQCYWNAVKLAKENGYKYAVLTNFDMLFSKNDIEKIKCTLNTVIANKTDGFFFYSMNEEGPTYATVFCIVDVDMFLRKFPNEIMNEDDYNNLMTSVNSESNGLENIYFHVLKNENLTVKNERESGYFESDKCLTNSQGDYLAILPMKHESDRDSPTESYGIFIRRANKDIIETKLILNIRLLDSDESICNDEFIINSDFVKIVPFVFDKTKSYEITLLDQEKSHIIKQTYRKIVDFEVLEKNGNIIYF